jgi:DNA-binding GntR family transcriptional regulator
MNNSKSATRPAERVYSAIYEAVQAHRLAPGEKLKEVELSQIFQVSRASIRSAFQRLSHQGLLSIAPNRGASVASLTPEDGRQIFAARRAIESAIVDELARAARPADVALLRRQANKQRAAFQAGDTKKGHALAIEFHHLLGQLSTNRILARFLDQLLSRMPLVVLTRGGTREPLEAAHRDHEGHMEIVDAIAKGDAAGAARILREHLHDVEAELDRQRSRPAESMAEILGVSAPARTPARRVIRQRVRS